MECAEIRDGFSAGRVPAGPALEAHLEQCPHCRELFAQGARLGRGLAGSVLPEVESGSLFALIDQRVKSEVGVRARLRALPSQIRAGVLFAVALALLSLQLKFEPRADLAQVSPWVFWGIVALLLAAILWGAMYLARGARVPLGLQRRARAVALLLLGWPAVVLLLLAAGSGSAEGALTWDNPAGCFSYGACLVAPLVLLWWLFEQRDRAPVAALVSAGALAGVAANLLLHAHCASAHLGHLLLGHFSIGAFWALSLWLLSKPAQLLR